MSVAIRWPVGKPGEFRCITDLGEMEYSCPRPDRGEVGHLMLTTPEWVEQRLIGGPVLMPWGGQYSATADERGTFVRLDYMPYRAGTPGFLGLPVPEPEHPAGSWTWRILDAHFVQQPDGRPVMIGCWPD